VTAAVCALIDPSRGSFHVQLEAADMQQRLRAGSSRLFHDLGMAGAGAYSGGRAGPLTYWFAPVVPYRLGEAGGDPPGTFKADTLTLWYVPPTAAQTSVAVALGPGQLVLHVDLESGCPQDQDLCGFTVGMTLLVYDGHGKFDTFTLLSTSSSSGQLRVNNADGLLRSRYEAGSISSRTTTGRAPKSP
jgi:hypothetical protein